MECSVVRGVKPNDFLNFSLKSDALVSMSAEDSTANVLAIPELCFFRVELERFRPGMSDFLIKFSTQDKPQSSTTLVVLRGTKNLSRQEACVAAARVVVREMKSRGNTACDWDKVDLSNLAKMIQSPIKYFIQNSSSVQLRFVTEAL